MGDAATGSEPIIIGDYVVGERLGGGGFGEVFAGTHRLIGGEVAIKILHAYRCADPVAVARFIAEARAVNKIRHSGIVDVFDFGELPDGRHYFAMERLRGRTLRAILDSRSRLPRGEAVPLLRGIAAAVDAAHAAGVIHRDLKPENVIVADDGSIKLIDFGIAKLTTDATMTATDTILGTPAYMSPEQCRGGTVDEASDLYSFGALAYHMLTGAPPFNGDPLALALHHLNDRPQRPSRRAPEISTAVDAPILALLDKEPERRPRPLVAVVERIAGPARVSGRRLTGALVAAGIVAALVIGARALLAPAAPLVIDPAAAKIRAMPIEGGRIMNLLWMSPDGAFVTFSTLQGVRKEYLDDGRTEALPQPVAFVSFDRRGRALVGGDFTNLAPPGSSEMSSFGGDWPEPCDSQIAVIDSGVLVIVDEETLTRRVLGPAPGAWGTRWSPSCRRLVWTSSDRVLHLTDAGTGKTSAIEIPVALYGNTADVAAAFVGEDAIAYCRDDAGAVVLAIHYLDGRAPDTSLHAFPHSVDGCRIAASRDGRRLDVMAVSQAVDFAIVDPTRTDLPILTPTGARTDEFPEVFVDDETLIVTRHGRHMSQDPIVPTAVGIARSSRIIHGDGTSTPMTACRGETAIVMRDGAPVHVVLDGESLELRRDGGCELVGRWSLGVAHAVWSRPSCAGTVCVIAGRAGIRISVLALDAGASAARRVLDFESDVPVRDSIPVAQIALSPDAARVVVLVSATARLDFVTLATGARNTVVVGRGLDPGLENPVWDDATHFFVSTNGLAGTYGVFRFDLEGHFQRIATATDYLTLGPRSPSGKRLAVRTASFAFDQLVVDLPAFTR